LEAPDPGAGTVVTTLPSLATDEVVFTHLLCLSPTERRVAWACPQVWPTMDFGIVTSFPVRRW